MTGGNGSSYEVDEQEEETELQPNEWLAYRNHWNLEGDKVISKSETFLKKEDVNSSELDDDSKIQITVGMEATYIRQWQLNDDYYVVNYQTSEDYETEMEDVDYETEMEDVDYETEMEGLTPINSETSSEVIDNLLEKEGWEISTDISISDTSGQWRNLFHYGNNDETRAPAMWIFKNQHWKLHFRIKTTSNWNDGLDFNIPEEFRNPGQTFNVRIRHEG